MSYSNKTKYLFVSRGPGETAQARALANYIADKGKEVYFVLHQKINYSFLEKDKDKFNIFIAEKENGFVKWNKPVKKIKPDVLLLFNSKMQGWNEDFRKEPLEEKPLTICVDSNWLFNEEKYPWYPFVKWADKYLVNIPEKIFNLGLKENGGDFIISSKVKERVKPVGLIPSYEKPSRKKKEEIRKKHNIEKDEKLIFSYFSGLGADHRPWAFNNLIEATKELQEEHKIKVIYIGPTKNKKINYPWLVTKERLGIEEYYLTLASSDLIFQHQGLATLEQAISAQVPVIANVTEQEKEGLERIHFWEVEPFNKAGVCSMFSKEDSTSKIANEIEKLLYNTSERKSMKKLQKKYHIIGEEKAYETIQDTLQKT